MADLMYLISFLEDVDEGTFELGNLEDAKHITIVPEFSLPNKELDAVRVKFDRAASWFGLFNIEAVRESVFGEDDNPVSVVEVSGIDCNGNSIFDLHRTFTEIIYNAGGVCSSPQYCFDNFSPHISYMNMFSNNLNIHNVSLIHHRDGFGKNVINLRNYFFNACK